MYFNELMLVDLNLEYYNLKTRNPFSSVAWFEEENKYFHPFSLEMSLETFGYHKLAEIMTLKEYLEWPNILVEETLNSLSKGLRKREEAEAARAKERAQKNPDGLDKAQRAELKKAGINLDN